ncbi:MAG: hypothetical protein COW00_01245 [Bdellovibrio sp. CG12_big_fil_rev_8_21_14_0_65_39_13]|nr:MAG: hypothetical protein COW78_15745 [Bdellovibrio sp. CG22_combo_CG10-13_8_21_14_all_39_27]PIQ62668.1 MAG: hypothetical protein COW00_01245 [Bdellovibrio sp. CG12_big_fil_rev_8_21_14_0_65_39_13]PIR33552.1 MAG: hypothetical protein COV37_15945 [Bdellovibrio sp. CG11_big_fil_rev_8_21_14_0_20_39_38]
MLAENLRKALNLLDWSVPKLSKESGVNNQTIHNWLKGQVPRDLSQVKLVASTLGMSLDELCFGDAPSTKPNVFEEHEDLIYAGQYEVVLRRIKK